MHNQSIALIATHQQEVEISLSSPFGVLLDWRLGRRDYYLCLRFALNCLLVCAIFADPNDYLFRVAAVAPRSHLRFMNRIQLFCELLDGLYQSLPLTLILFGVVLMHFNTILVL